VIVCFWHGRIALSAVAWPMDRVRDGTAKEPRALISLSPDGAFIASAMARLGFPAIRGSSTKETDKAKPKGGASAFREVMRWLATGGGVAITPDGPRGPAEQMAPGTVRIARRAQVPVFLLGLAARPALRLKSWDRTKLPGLFGRGCIVWDGPHVCPADATEEEMDRMSVEWAAAMTAACARADAVLHS
jgi:lysophospholipid acyltransferase (LPLAT)-like uncharacterized protein